jgi:hypothetical protein
MIEKGFEMIAKPKTLFLHILLEIFSLLYVNVEVLERCRDHSNTPSRVLAKTSTNYHPGDLWEKSNHG